MKDFDFVRVYWSDHQVGMAWTTNCGDASQPKARQTPAQASATLLKHMQTCEDCIRYAKGLGEGLPDPEF